MSTWYSKPLGDGVAALIPTGQILQAYMTQEHAGLMPADSAVFSYYDRRQYVVTAYFSPSAVLLARAFGASPCARPERKEGFSMLVGSAGAWDLLFGK